MYPDTNVFMHYQSIDEIPLADIVGTQGSITIVVAPSVVDELDLQKVKHPNPDLRERAKQVVARLAAWRRDGKAVLKNGTGFAFRVQRHAKDLRELGLDVTIRDDHLLAEILTEREARAGRHILLTADLGPELRAGSLQIEVLTPPEAYRLPVPDGKEKELRRLKAELRRLQERQPILTLRFPDGSEHQRFVVRRPAPLTDADIRAMVDRERRARIMADPARSAETDVAGLVASMSVATLGPSVGAIRAYNEEVQEYLSKYEEHVRLRWLADQELAARTLEISLQLCNDGSLTASTVRVRIVAPAGIELFESAPRGHRMPQPPERPRALFDPGGPMLPEAALRGFTPPVRPNVRGPYLTDDEPPAIAFQVDTALHKKTYHLEPLYLVFPTIQAIRSIALQAATVSDELPDWGGSELHVVVALEDSLAE